MPLLSLVRIQAVYHHAKISAKRHTYTSRSARGCRSAGDARAPSVASQHFCFASPPADAASLAPAAPSATQFGAPESRLAFPFRTVMTFAGLKAWSVTGISVELRVVFLDAGVAAAFGSAGAPSEPSSAS